VRINGTIKAIGNEGILLIPFTDLPMYPIGSILQFRPYNHSDLRVEIKEYKGIQAEGTIVTCAISATDDLLKFWDIAKSEHFTEIVNNEFLRKSPIDFSKC
jgi:hypothetical protein